MTNSKGNIEVPIPEWIKMCNTLHNTLNQDMKLTEQYENMFETLQTTIRRLETLESRNKTPESTKIKKSKDRNNASLPSESDKTGKTPNNEHSKQTEQLTSGHWKENVSDQETIQTVGRDSTKTLRINLSEIVRKGLET